jgi:hypothetical protein
VITKSSEAIVAFGVSALAHALAAQRVCANLSGTWSVSLSNLSTSAPPLCGYTSMAGLKYRWKISPKKSYSCSLIAAPQISDGHLNCAPIPSITAGFPGRKFRKPPLPRWKSVDVAVAGPLRRFPGPGRRPAHRTSTVGTPVLPVAPVMRKRSSFNMIGVSILLVPIVTLDLLALAFGSAHTRLSNSGGEARFT